MPRRHRPSLQSFRERLPLRWALVALYIVIPGIRPRTALAQTADSLPCGSAPTAAGIAGLTGTRIARLQVRTRPPRDLPGILRVLGRVHVQTKSSTIARELLIVEGDTVDSLRVAESLRRARALPFIDEAHLTSRRCADGSAELLFDSTDAWSTTPEGHYTTAAQTLGLHETNALGMGDGLSLVLRWELAPDGATYRFGAEAAFEQPAVTSGLGSAVTAALFPDGHRLYTALQTRHRTLADSWVARMVLRSSTQQPERAGGERFVRNRSELVVGRRVTSVDAASALYVQGGGVADRTELRAASEVPVVGPRTVERRFAGMSLGLARRATRYDTLTWILPHAGVADVPRGFEFDALGSLGRDAATGTTAMALDAWGGAMHVIGERTIVSTDAWGTMYRPRHTTETSSNTASVRGAITLVHARRNGNFTFTASGERVLDPDPDVGAFVGFDPALPFIPVDARRSAGASVMLAERTVHVHDISHTLMLDAGAFVSHSARMHSASLLFRDPLRVSLVGAGFRLTPDHQGRTTVRLDVAVPVRSLSVPSTPRFTVTLAPWFALGRLRLGPPGI